MPSDLVEVLQGAELAQPEAIDRRPVLVVSEAVQVRKVLEAAEELVRTHGPWDSGNPDHIAGDEPLDRLYNEMVRWARSGRPGVGP